jgi:uncharacterized SAM-binding protein YcdF (DUF218 family)
LLAIGYARAGRWLLVASILLITAVGVLPIGSGLALPLEARFPPWDAKHGTPTGIVVVGGGVIKSEISAERGEVTVGRTVDRINAAIELARRYPGAHVVFAGGGEGEFVVRYSKSLVCRETASWWNGNRAVPSIDENCGGS